MEYNGKFGHTLGRIHHISIMRIIEIFYTAFRLGTQTMAPTLNDFQGLKLRIQYLGSHPYNSCDGSNVIIPTWSGAQVEDYTIHNCLEFHQDNYHSIITNRR